MANISTLLDSPAAVSLIDGKLLAERGRGEGGGVLHRVLHKEALPYGPTSYPFINDS